MISLDRHGVCLDSQKENVQSWHSWEVGGVDSAPVGDAGSLGPVVHHLVPVEGRGDWGPRLSFLLNVDVWEEC